MLEQNKKFVFYILAFLLLFNVLAWFAVCDLDKARFLEVTFFDVGQGDAAFIKTSQQHQVLIDGGPSSAVLEKLGREMPFWDRTIDLIILTHPEKDHMTGLIEVLKRYKVENILWTGVLRDTAEFKEWQKAIEEEKDKDGAKIEIARSLLRINFNNSYIDILNPLENLEGQKIKDSNNTSIVAKLVFGENSFLFTGDIKKSAEKKLLTGGADLPSDILKVAHHGSKTSSNPDFIKKVSPDIAVISVGADNSYDHPSAETLETLEKYGMTVFRTDIDGDIKFFSDGKKIKSR